MVVRIVLWSVGDAKASLDEIRHRLDELGELEPPSMWLVNEAAERFGAVLALEDEDDAVGQIAAIRELIGKDPEVIEDFDAV
ncbi:MAG: hypothetical protein FJW96_15935 [Actinobacteria bacterium]|nr:hypothetical protein [Actinomycetota bacterium]